MLADGATTAARLGAVIRDLLPPEYFLGHREIGTLFLDLPSLFALVVWAGLFLALVALAAVTLVAWLAAAGAGIPTLRAALFMRIFVEAEPQGDYEMISVNVSAPECQERVPATELRHSSVYENPSVINKVVEVIQRFQNVRREKRTEQALHVHETVSH
jgi:hypothetical protein